MQPQIHKYQIYQLPPRQLPTVARQGLKFLLKNLLKPPIYPQGPEHAATNSQIPDLPIATETVAHGGQTELKVFVKKFTEAPNLPASGDQVCS